MLQDLHARGQALRIVAGLHLDARLDDGGTAVELRGHEMHGGAVFAFRAPRWRADACAGPGNLGSSEG